MALLNGIYVFVTDEDVDRAVDKTSHPVESGVDLTDNVRRQGTVLKIKGEIVGSDALQKLQKLTNMMAAGTIVPYQGRYGYSKMQLTAFNTSHPNTIWGGFSFDATLEEVRIAASAYTPVKTIAPRALAGPQQKKAQSITTKVYHTVKRGDTVWALVAAKNAPYRQYGFSCNDVMKNNPKAFSRYGDFRTLQIGRQLWVGNRK
jgi:LysM repeat protein